MSVKKLKGLLLDMDGVLWRDTQPIGDLPQTLARIKGMGLKAAFVTNNATRTVEQYVEKFGAFGAEVEAEQIFTSARATAAHLAKQHPNGGRVFIVGERGLVEALRERGFEQGEKDPLAVVVGLDRAVSYEKLTRATLLIRNGVPLIGTNPDATLPSPVGLAPGAGALIAALETASGAKAQIIGKPEPTLLEAAMSSLGVGPDETLMVGDRLETDIAAGRWAGCRTALVLTGASTQEQAEAWVPRPDYVVGDLNELLAELAKQG